MGIKGLRLAQIVPNLLFLHLRVIDVHKRPFSLEILDKSDIVFLAALSQKKTLFLPLDISQLVKIRSPAVSS